MGIYTYVCMYSCGFVCLFVRACLYEYLKSMVKLKYRIAIYIPQHYLNTTPKLAGVVLILIRWQENIMRNPWLPCPVRNRARVKKQNNSS